MKPVRHFLVKRQLDAFADSELLGGSAQSVLSHLDECVDCVTELELIVWTKTLLAQRGRADLAGSDDILTRLETWATTELLES